MMLGFPPPLFFQICWRFVSPAIIFVSPSLVPPLLPPWRASFCWEPAKAEHELFRPELPPGAPHPQLWSLEVRAKLYRGRQVWRLRTTQALALG